VLQHFTKKNQRKEDQEFTLNQKQVNLNKVKTIKKYQSDKVKKNKKVMLETFSYSLSETESLIFRTEQSKCYIFSKHEGTQEKQIATYSGGKWLFDSYDQRKLFFFLFSIYKKEFGKALKSYIHSLKEKPKMYEFTCVRRRFNIKITKTKSKISNWFYRTFYWR